MKMDDTGWSHGHVPARTVVTAEHLAARHRELGRLRAEITAEQERVGHELHVLSIGDGHCPARRCPDPQVEETDMRTNTDRVTITPQRQRGDLPGLLRARRPLRRDGGRSRRPVRGHRLLREAVMGAPLEQQCRHGRTLMQGCQECLGPDDWTVVCPRCGLPPITDRDPDRPAEDYCSPTRCDAWTLTPVTD